MKNFLICMFGNLGKVCIYERLYIICYIRDIRKSFNL